MIVGRGPVQPCVSLAIISVQDLSASCTKQPITSRDTDEQLSAALPRPARGASALPVAVAHILTLGTNWLGGLLRHFPHVRNGDTLWRAGQCAAALVKQALSAAD